LVQKCGAPKTYINFLIELEDLNGRKAFPEGVEIETILKL
jgi:adenine phosphoribosyltransferase